LAWTEVEGTQAHLQSEPEDENIEDRICATHRPKTMWQHGDASWQAASNSPAATPRIGNEQYFSNTNTNKNSAPNYASGAPQNSSTPLLSDTGISSNIISVLPPALFLICCWDALPNTITLVTCKV
jgi:hypothetical protein